MNRSRKTVLFLLLLLSLQTLGAVAPESLLVRTDPAPSPAESCTANDIAGPPGVHASIVGVILYSVKVLAPPLYEWITGIKVLVAAVADAMSPPISDNTP